MPDPKPPLSPAAKVIGLILILIGGGSVLLAVVVIGILLTLPDPPPRDKTTADAAVVPKTLVAREPAAKPAATVAPKAPPRTDVRAQGIINAYNENEIAADQKYKGRTLDISGVVESIGKDILGTPYVTLDVDGIFGLQAMFPRKAENELARLKPGQWLVVNCRIEGKLGNVVARGCSLP